MNTKPVFVVFLMAAISLAGCGGKDKTTDSTSSTTQLQVGKGAISGLIIDDVYRPVPGALILVQEAGLTASADTSGQFSFVDLEPGSYILKVQAADHATAPQNVEVKAGQYTEVEIKADRLANGGSRIVTTEYSVFISCAASVPAASYVDDCTFDQSGDTNRPGFNSNYTGYPEATYLVTEMLANADASPEHGAYKVVVRDSGGGDPYWASKFIVEGRYMKLIMKVGTISADDTETGRNKNWTNDATMQTILFPQGAFKAESQSALDAECSVDPLGAGCFESRGLGPQVGVRAKFVQSLFIGEPTMPIEDYSTLKPG